MTVLVDARKLGRQVTIRGVKYLSISEAAEHLGVSANTIRGALENGTLDNVGLSKKRPMFKSVRGVPVFKSVRAK